MTVFLGILLTIFVFTIIVFIHEMGHFLTARFTKMRVEEFGIGIPPKAKSLRVDKHGTEYTLNWLPIGGFVRIKGEDPGSSEARQADAFSAKKWWARALVLVAGVVMNFVLAFVIFIGFFTLGAGPLGPNLITDKDYGSYLLPSFERSLETGYIEHSGLELTPQSGSVAERANLLPGDVLDTVDGKKISDIDSLRISLASEGTHTIGVSGTGGYREVTLIPEGGKIGVAISYKDLRVNKEYHEDFSLFEAIGKAGYETYALSYMTFDVLMNTLRKLIVPANPVERQEATEMLSGPIGIGSTFTEVVSYGITWKIFFSLIALLSLNLGVLNILPFPALDGGRLVSTTLRSIIGLFTQKTKTLDMVEYLFHSFGMILLLGASLIIAVLDVSKLI